MRDAVCDCFGGYACPLGDLVVSHFLETVHLECLTVFIRELPDEYRKAFEMNRFEEMTYNEIAERTGVSPKTIAYRISQALKILRTELKDYIPLLVWLLYEQTRS